MRCLFAGTPEVALSSLDAVLASRHEVIAVLTRPDAVAGRGRRETPSPVALRAREAGIDVLAPTSAKDPYLLEAIRELAPDCAPVVAYGGLIPPSLLAVPRHGWVNLHFSMLPAWRGAAPVQWAIWHGDDVTGATTFALDEGLDTGPVYGIVTERIRPDDTSGSTLERLAGVGSTLLVATLDAIEAGAVEALPQVGSPTFAPKITVDDARVRWDLPAIAIDRQVRACTPAPGAWTTFEETRVRVQPVVLAADHPALAPGELHVANHDVWAGTATAPVRLGLVQQAGKRAMPAEDWARGLRLADGVVLR